MAIPARRVGLEAQSAGLLLSAALLGCANVVAPPGGPPDSTPPHIIVTRPESGAVVSHLDGDAVLRFDEVIDEMGGGGGGGGRGGASGGGGLSGLARQVILSPVAGEVRVSWHRSAIHVKPAEGWKPGRVYHLQLLPGTTDLRHNVMKQGAMVVFSTGPALPHASLAGTALQWVEQRALARAVIRATLLPDTVAYVALADSGGGFTFTDIPAGRYRVEAIQDLSANRERDPHEPFDYGTVVVDSSASVVLWAFEHDTTGPKLKSATASDSLTIRFTLSQPLEPGHPLDTARVHVFLLPDTTPVSLASVATGPQYDSTQARARAVLDSTKRANDTTARARGAGAAPRAAAGKPDSTKSLVDTAHIGLLLRQRPIPTDKWVARTTAPLVAGAKYLVRVTHAINLSGATSDAQTVFVMPTPKAPAPKPEPRVKHP